MLRRFSSIIITIFFVTLSFFFATPILAEDAVFEFKKSDLDLKLEEFCDKRSGNQMNLETWYSGKCTADSMSGEGVGFSDIVILDLAERVTGPKDSSKDILIQIYDAVMELNKIQGSNTLTPNEKNLALNSIRANLFSSNNDSLTGQTGKFISFFLNTRPASTLAYLDHISQNLKTHHIIPQSFAANTDTADVTGAGFSTMSTFIPLWKITRNMAYTVMIIIFIAYGFMMMFRVNLGQKTVISVQLAIPKLIVTFLAITFSFAIVGLAMDLMWVVFWVILYYLSGQNIIAIGNPFVWASSGRGGMILSAVVNSLAATLNSPFVITNLLIGGPSIIGGIVGVGGLFLGGWVFGVAIIIAVLVSYIKLFSKLLVSFVSLVVSLVMAPIILLGNAFPGSKSIGTWFRNVLANVSVFPVTMVLLLFSYILIMQPIVNWCPPSWTDIVNTTAGDQLGKAGTGSACEILFGVRNLTPKGYINTIPLITPMLGDANAGFTPDALLGLVGIVLLLMASKYVDIVKDALKVPPFKYGTDVGKALEGGIRSAESLASRVAPGSKGAVTAKGAVKAVDLLKKQ